MTSQLQSQSPMHFVPSNIVGLLLSSGWDVNYNDTQSPYIYNILHPSWTFSTWWDCLSAVVAEASDELPHLNLVRSS
jgi:hypothetical protein